MKYLLSLTVGAILFFSFVQAEENYTLTQNLAKQLKEVSPKSLANATQYLHQFEHDELGHLTDMLAYHIEELKRMIGYVNSHFANLDLLQEHMVDSLSLGMTFVEEGISNEVQLIQLASKQVTPKVSGTVSELTAQTERLIKKGKDSLVAQRFAREHPEIAQEVQLLENLLKHLQNAKLNEAELRQHQQLLDLRQNSLQVLEDKARWRLPCSHHCYPTNTSLLQLTDPQIVLHLVELLQNYKGSAEYKVKQTTAKIEAYKKAGYENLTSALAYQSQLQTQFLSNLNAHLVKDEQIFTTHYFQVIVEDELRSNFRLKEEDDIIEGVIRGAPRNETNHKLLSRANLLVKLSKDFVQKHPNAYENAEILNEEQHLEQLVVRLKSLQAKEANIVPANPIVEKQLDRHQKTLIQLMDQANPNPVG